MSAARKRNRVRSVFSSVRSVRTRRRRCGGMLLLGVMQKVLAKIGPQAGSARLINTRFVDDRTRELRYSAPPARWQWCACFVARWQFWDGIGPRIARKCHFAAPGTQDCHLVGHGCTNVPPRRSGLSCCPARWQWCAYFVARWQIWDEIGPGTARNCHFAAPGAQDCHFAAPGARGCHLAAPGAAGAAPGVGGADAASGRGAEHGLGVEPDHPDAYNLVG